MRRILFYWLALAYCVAFWVLLVVGVTTLAAMVGHCQTPPRQCSNAALIRIATIAGELLRPEPPPVMFDAGQWQIAPPVFIAPDVPPGPAWIPKSRCNRPHVQALNGEQLRGFAEFNQCRQVQREYDVCYLIPTTIPIPVWWWDWQYVEHCGEPELNYVDGAFRRICWGNIERANAGLVIPGTPSPPVVAMPKRPPTNRPTPTRGKAAERAEMLSEFMELSRLCGTLRE